LDFVVAARVLFFGRPDFTRLPLAGLGSLGGTIK